MNKEDLLISIKDRGMVIPYTIYYPDKFYHRAFTDVIPSALFDKDPFTLNLGYKKGDKELIDLFNVCIKQGRNAKIEDVNKYLSFYEYWGNIVGIWTYK